MGSGSQVTRKKAGPVAAPPVELDERAPPPAPVPPWPSDDGLEGARGLMVGVILGGALWLILLAAVILGRVFRAVKFG